VDDEEVSRRQQRKRYQVYTTKATGATFDVVSYYGGKTKAKAAAVDIEDRYGGDVKIMDVKTGQEVER
jgi:rhamnose utilization protein RhaD (predicted bifunctional aldolase and dehydrogenase)